MRGRIKRVQLDVSLKAQVQSFRTRSETQWMGTGRRDVGERQPWLLAPGYFREACAERVGGHNSETERKRRESQVQLQRGGASQGEKGKNVKKSFCKRGSFQVPLITSQQSLNSLSSFPSLLPSALKSFHLGSWESLTALLYAINLSPCQSTFYTVARNILLKYKSDHVILCMKTFNCSHCSSK